MKVESTLPAALGFTSADLDANRLGKLSQAQIELMTTKRHRNSLVAAVSFIAMVLGATILFYMGQLSHSTILFGAGAMLSIINAIMVGRAGRAFMQVGGDLRVGQVEMLAGEVERVLRRGRALDNYLLRIDGAEFFVTRDVFVGFRHEAPYRIYRASYSGQLLSAEPDG